MPSHSPLTCVLYFCLLPSPLNPQIDWQALGNHFYLLPSLGYLLAHAYDSFRDDRGLSDESMRWIFWSLSCTFFFDSFFYVKFAIKGIWPKQRFNQHIEMQTIEMEENQSEDSARRGIFSPMAQQSDRQQFAVGDIGEHAPSSDARISVPDSAASMDSDTTLIIGDPDFASSADPAELEAAVQEAAFFHHQRVTLFPLSITSLAEVFNVLGSVFSFSSANVPVFSDLLSEDPSSWNVTSIWLDFLSVFSFTISAIYYYYDWHRFSGSSAYIQVRNPGFWAEFFNFFGSVLYLGATGTALGLYYDWINADESTQLNNQLKAQIVSFAGDFIYVFSAIFYEITWWMDQKRGLKFWKIIDQQFKNKGKKHLEKVKKAKAKNKEKEKLKQKQIQRLRGQDNVESGSRDAMEMEEVELNSPQGRMAGRESIDEEFPSQSRSGDLIMPSIIAIASDAEHLELDTDSEVHFCALNQRSPPGNDGKKGKKLKS